MMLAGLDGQPVDIYKYYDEGALDTYNLIASIGSFVLALGVLLTLGNAAYSARRGVAVGADPWRGSTLEWFALSPPPPHNFDVIPDVRGTEPLRDIRDAVRHRTETWRPPRVERPPAAQPAESFEDARGGPPVA
jgi:cytochrome c oxidase subunit I